VITLFSGPATRIIGRGRFKLLVEIITAVTVAGVKIDKTSGSHGELFSRRGYPIFQFTVIENLV
jgi:hypothetical protein